MAADLLTTITKNQQTIGQTSTTEKNITQRRKDFANDQLNHRTILQTSKDTHTICCIRPTAALRAPVYLDWPNSFPRLPISINSAKSFPRKRDGETTEEIDVMESFEV